MTSSASGTRTSTRAWASCRQTSSPCTIFTIWSSLSQNSTSRRISISVIGPFPSIFLDGLVGATERHRSGAGLGSTTSGKAPPKWDQEHGATRSTTTSMTVTGRRPALLVRSSFHSLLKQFPYQPHFTWQAIFFTRRCIERRWASPRIRKPTSSLALRSHRPSSKNGSLRWRHGKLNLRKPLIRSASKPQVRMALGLCVYPCAHAVHRAHGAEDSARPGEGSRTARSAARD